jgi:hypothetical protein
MRHSFHVGTAAGEGDAKTAISLTETGHLGWIDGGDNQFVTSNTWHNLVYATQGSGGVRTCYLDGRKLGDAQVQDTFGDYPPFAMNTYSEYGYTVSASTEYGGYEAWEAFDDITGSLGTSSYWSGSTQVYSNGNWNGGTSSTYTTNVEGTNKYGEWLQIEFPHKIKYSYSTILAPYDHEERVPRDGYIVGSNDTSGPWTTLHRFEDVTRTSTSETVTYVPSSAPTQAFKYLRIVIENMTSGGGNYAGIDQWNIFGHKENDTTRFPVSSTALKYPHIEMTGPAQRGYVVTESSYSTYNANYGYGWKAFDSTRSSVSSEFSWQTDAATYGSSGNARTGVAVETITENSNTHVGSWVTLETPHKIQVSSVELTCPVSIDQYRPNSVVILGSDNNSTWNFLKGDISSTYTNDIRTITINSSVAYKYHMLLVKTIGSVGAGYATTAFLSDIRYYGTEPEDVIARVGEGLDGKVANFRVYDKYLHEEQALELWDAQKDQFGRATSSVVVHKGRLGVGTTEPEGRFAVLDEAHESEEFPPRAMTDYETYMEGHGVFKVTYSPWLSNGVYHLAAWQAFDDSGNYHNNIWHSERNDDVNDGYYTGTDGAYTGTNSLGGVLGDYVILESPYKTNITKINLKGRHQGTDTLTGQTVKSFYFMASNDNVTWDILTQKDSLTQWTTSGYTFVIPNTKYYKYYAVVPTKGNSAYVTLSELRYFGTREQGQSTLHDGELKLTKNLTVPRIGPPLDADDTPRRDRLVVEYNTSTNPTENGMVRDTSGRGLDGLIRGSASYDATEKAFDVVASSDIITTGTNIGGVSGDFLTSVSLWFKPSTVTSSTSQILFIHTSAYAAAASFLVNIYEDQIKVGHGSTNNSYKDGSLVANEWHHVVAIKKGTGAVSNNIYEIYLNGTKLALTNDSGTDVMNVGSDQAIIIGGASKVAVNIEQFVGKISNVKYYPGIVLTADEVKRLYDMGRFDEGHHVVNFSKTRVGIGLGDGEAPRADLDVRGDVMGGCPAYFSGHLTSNYNGIGIVPWDTIHIIKGCSFDTSTGRLTIEIKGKYRVYYTARQWGSDATGIYLRTRINGTQLGTGYGAIYLNTTRDQAGTTVILDLDVGDVVDIYSPGAGGGLGANYNAFTVEYLSSI